ncbi:MAG: N-6 DNA methylase, partial [Candidatus Eisenbacteria bacterium]|nr:N-6 DNA methylase [Candidatus Eisenbacteria bacterium]
MNHSQIVSFIWGVADLIRDTFKRGKYQDVILPLTVLRRLDCVLAPTKEKVLAVQAKYKGKIENLDPQLRKASGFAFYNTSRYDFERLLADAPDIAKNLRTYIAGFSPNMREVLEKFDFDNTIAKLDEAGLLFQVVQRFGDPKVDLHPDTVDNFAMGTIFEELIRKFNEALNENPGEHFTPRDVVHLMVDLLLAGDEKRLRKKGVVLSVYDPCCGSGGMLTVAKEHITIGERREGETCDPAVNPGADVHLFGQEVNPETFAICKSDLFMKSQDGRDAENILYGSTLSNDRHAAARFDYMIANPPYGKDWKRDEQDVRGEHDRGAAGRFAPGLPRISDGQLLFLLHMLAHAKDQSRGGSRVAIIMNGSPLFTGDAGSGESEIRRWVLEQDLLEALIALPEQLFYNTGIATYVWVLTNRKRPERRGRVQLIDATGFWTPLRKSLGAKRREIPFHRKEEILGLLAGFADEAQCRVVKDGEEREAIVSRIYPATHFGFRKITVERPLRLDFQAGPERIARLDEERAVRNLAVSKKKGAA